MISKVSERTGGYAGGKEHCKEKEPLVDWNTDYCNWHTIRSFCNRIDCSVMKKDMWRWVERVISIAIIAGLIIDAQVDKRTWKESMKQSKEKDEKHDEYISRQNEINGKFIILYDYFIAGAGAGAEEGP